MPQMGVSVAEGTIVEWNKRPGDWVERDETVCLVTTDKIDVEIPSPAAGRLERILVEPGDTVAAGTALAEPDSGAKPGEAHPAARAASARRECSAAGARAATWRCSLRLRDRRAGADRPGALAAVGAEACTRHRAAPGVAAHVVPRQPPGGAVERRVLLAIGYPER